MNISPDEKLTYFINSKSGYARTKKEVKARAFAPTSGNPTELSVYRISSITESQIWEVGRKYVEGKIKIKARADFSASIFYENPFFLERNIKVIPDPHPHELHANIIPIPTIIEDRDEIFDELALFCELVMLPENF